MIKQMVPRWHFGGYIYNMKGVYKMKPERNYVVQIRAEHPKLGTVMVGLVGGWAAGIGFYLVEVVHCPADPSLIGKHLCCGEYWPTCVYRAEVEWSDGFVSNVSTDCEDLPYYSDGRVPDGGTPMGGEIVPELDGLRFKVTQRHIDRHLRWIDGMAS